MGLTITALTLVLCDVIININCERTNDYWRIKRAKYYPPLRFYRPTRMVPYGPAKGLFSYTPAPNYMMDDDKQSSSFRPPNVKGKSKRPTISMSEEDINNIVKFMSQKDLDKLIEMAEKEKYIDKYKIPEYNESEREIPKPGSDIYKADVQEMDADNFNPFSYGDSNHNYAKESTQSRIIYRKPPNKEYLSQQLNYQGINPDINYMKDSSKIMYANSESPTPDKLINSQDIIDYEMNVRNADYMKDISTQFTYSNLPNIENGLLKTKYKNLEDNQSYIQHTGLDMNEVKEDFNLAYNFNEMITKDGHIFTDDSILQDEELPKPLNLREEEQVISHTKNVPRVVKADSSYEVKNFGDLPLMNYHNSKLESVSSYHVPHYTVSTIILINS